MAIGTRAAKIDPAKFVNAMTIRGGLGTTIQAQSTTAGVARRDSLSQGGAAIAVAIWTDAERHIQSKWNSLGGAPGAPTVAGLKGVVTIGDGFYREYAGGRIYYQAGLGAFWVYGYIGNRYTEIGGPNSWLGFPTSDEAPFFDGRGSTFQHGAIYWWQDTGAIELGDVIVRYAGLACFGETNELSDSDEPYVLFGVVSPFPERNTAPRTRVYEDVDAGDSREDTIELYRGLPYGLSLTTVLMEHDLSDPDKYQESVKIGVERASDAVALGIGAVPYVGPFVAPVARVILKAIAPDIVEFIDDEIIGAPDDHIGTVVFDVSPRDMVRLTRVERQNFRGILWHLDSPLISDGSASYKVYIDIQAV